MFPAIVAKCRVDISMYDKFVSHKRVNRYMTFELRHDASLILVERNNLS